MRLVLLLALLVGCSSPPPKRKRPPRPPLPELSADRERPSRFEVPLESGLEDDLSTTFRVPRAGVWWVEVSVPERSDRLSKLSISVGGPYDVFSLGWIDGAQTRSAKVVDGYGEVEFPETTTPPRAVLLQITTTTRAKLRVSASRRHRSLPEVLPPPCDPDHIDRTNPNCAGVYPRCDPNKPDFKNPRCCDPATCSYGRLTCRAKLVTYDAKHPVTTATISLGAKDEIVTFARGKLYQRFDRDARSVSDVYVAAVAEHESWIKIESPDRVDPAKLADSWVILSAPEPCAQRR